MPRSRGCCANTPRLSQHASLVDNENADVRIFGLPGRYEMTERITEPQPNVIESSASFSVRVLGHIGLRCQEGDRSVWIDSEVLAKPRAIAMYMDSIKYWEGCDPGQVSDADRGRSRTILSGHSKPADMSFRFRFRTMNGWPGIPSINVRPSNVTATNKREHGSLRGRTCPRQAQGRLRHWRGPDKHSRRPAA